MNNENSDHDRSLFRKKILHSLAWVAGLKYFGQIISWVAFIVVVRHLSPEDFGLMAEASVCIFFLTMLSELGLGVAIVQKKDLTELELRQNFSLILIANILLILILYSGAPFIAAFFSEPRLIQMLKTLSIVFIFIGFYAVPQAKLQRGFNFRAKSLVEFASVLFSATVTLVLVLNGYGVWGLVWGSISMHAVLTLGYNIAARPFLWPAFSFRGVGRFISFGGFVTGERILWSIYSKADITMGGRFLTSSLLGLYSVSMTLVSIPLEKFSPIINQIALPVYSKIQSDLKLAATYFLKSVRITSLIMFPIYGGFIIVIPEFVEIFLGDKWDKIILPIQILALVMPLRTVNNLFSPAISGLGRPDITFGNMGITFLIMVASFYYGVQKGIIGLCFAWLVGYSITFIIVTSRSLKVFKLKRRMFFSSMSRPFVATIVMVISIYLLKYSLGHYLPLIIRAIMEVVCGAIVYYFAIMLLNRELIYEIIELLPDRFRFIGKRMKEYGK